VLPTFLAVSSLSASNVFVTLVGFVVFYSALLLVDIFLMAKAIKAGPAAVSDDSQVGAFTRLAPAE
jgi:cytochrome d ubiquinol oxidase subunit I